MATQYAPPTDFPCVTSARVPTACPFVVYKEVPAGCIPFTIPDDSSAPHLRAGDVVVIDLTDREPAEGELFAITWKSDWRGRWQIVQTDLRMGRYGYGEELMWFVGAPAPHPMVPLSGGPITRAQRWVDGPYDDNYLREIAHGRVIGIFAPDFQLAEVN